MRILFVHETEYIEKVIFEYQIVPEILASSGHDIFVIDFPSTWKKNNFFDYGSLKPKIIKDVRRADKKRGVTLIRPGFLKIPIISRITAFISYWFIIPKVIKKNNIDCIVLYSVPTNGLQVIYWAKKLRIPVFFRLFDVLHEIVPFKVLKPITYLLEKKVYKNVNMFAATAHKLTEYGVLMGAPRENSFYLPTGSDTDLFYPNKKDSNLMKKLRIKETDTVIGFAGTLYDFSGLDDLILYFGKNKEKYKGVKIVISGHGEQEQYLKEVISKYSISEQVILTGFVEYEKLPEYINISDVCINLFLTNNLTRDIIPGKIYQYIACGKVVISTRLPGVLKAFPEKSVNKSVVYCDENNPKQALELALNMSGRKAVDNEPSIQEIAKRYEDSIAKLVEINDGN